MDNKEIEKKRNELDDLEFTMDKIQGEIEDMVAAVVHKDHPEIELHDIYCPFEHECEQSPFGYCVYDESENSAVNNCLYCGEPRERNVI